MTTAKKTSGTPDDQPFDFNLDALKSEVELRPFRIHYGGRRWEMQHLEVLDIWDLVGAAEQGEISAMLGAFRGALGDDFDDFRKLGLPQWKLKPLFDAYRKHCGVGEGESPASTDS